MLVSPVPEKKCEMSFMLLERNKSQPKVMAINVLIQRSDFSVNFILSLGGAGNNRCSIT
jgi:hypothetical protein